MYLVQPNNFEKKKTHKIPFWAIAVTGAKLQLDRKKQSKQL